MLLNFSIAHIFDLKRYGPILNGIMINKGIHLILCLAMTLLACEERMVGQSTSVDLYISPDPLRLSTYFSEISAIPIKNHEIIGSIDKMMFTPEHLVVSDFYHMKSLKIFNRSGVLLNAKDDIGEGPGGLSEITDFVAYNDTIYVLDAYRKKMYKFSENLELLRELSIPIPVNNFLINDNGFFFYCQGKKVDLGRITKFSHNINFIDIILPSETFDTEIVFSSTDQFIPVNEESFAITNPMFPYFYYYNKGKLTTYSLNFNGNFFNIENLDGLTPPDQLSLVNNFDGFYNLSNGIKLNEKEFLFSVIFKKKRGYLKINIETLEMHYFKSIKNDLAKLPSTINFSGNSSAEAWYWMTQHDLSAFYQLNDHRIPDKDRIILNDEKDNQVFFVLSYN